VKPSSGVSHCVPRRTRLAAHLKHFKEPLPYHGRATQGHDKEDGEGKNTCPTRSPLHKVHVCRRHLGAGLSPNLDSQSCRMMKSVPVCARHVGDPVDDAKQVGQAGHLDVEVSRVLPVDEAAAVLAFAGEVSRKRRGDLSELDSKARMGNAGLTHRTKDWNHRLMERTMRASVG
jgi:hypothetical protein